MKTLKTLLLAFAIIASYTINAQVAITTDGSSADGSAMLEVESTTKGFLPPRLTELQRDAIASPAVGLVIYNITTNCLNFYNGSGWNAMCGTPPPGYPAGSVFCASGATEIVDVLSPTGKTWMDRNLGASQVAASSTDLDSYGDLYQWGRSSDGHQCTNSVTTSELSTTAQPAHGHFILKVGDSNRDWMDVNNLNRWNASPIENNPCPNGYRIPTEAELDAERASWGVDQNPAGAFASPLKLPMAGIRNGSDGAVSSVGTLGRYWSSTVALANDARCISFFGSNAGFNTDGRARGYSVRCIKD